MMNASIFSDSGLSTEAHKYSLKVDGKSLSSSRPDDLTKIVDFFSRPEVVSKLVTFGSIIEMFEMMRPMKSEQKKAILTSNNEFWPRLVQEEKKERLSKNEVTTIVATISTMEPSHQLAVIFKASHSNALQTLLNDGGKEDLLNLELRLLSLLSSRPRPTEASKLNLPVAQPA